MKQYMYTYHYFQRRTIQRHPRTANYVFSLVLLSSTAYITAALIYLTM